MNRLTDQQLLRDYAEDRSESAFAELVRRHVDFVYSAALRMVRDAHLAKDVTQAAFLALAKSAPELIGYPTLEGWLHVTTRNLAANAVRAEVRRRTYEQEAATMHELLSTGASVNWEHVAPHLDDALGELAQPERDALLLRYFKNCDFRTIGAALGISDDAAQKRVSRAVERLREHFAKRGITVGAGGLAVVISANAVQAAPASLVATMASAAAKGALASASIPTAKAASAGLATTGVAGVFSALFSPLLTLVLSQYITRSAVAHSKSKTEKDLRLRFGRKIVLSNFCMALAGIPAIFISPPAHPFLFAGSIVLLLIAVATGVAMQIIWSIRHKNELALTRTEPPLEHFQK